MCEKQELVTLFFAVPVPLFAKTHFCVAHPVCSVLFRQTMTLKSGA